MSNLLFIVLVLLETWLSSNVTHAVPVSLMESIAVNNAELPDLPKSEIRALNLRSSRFKRQQPSLTDLMKNPLVKTLRGMLSPGEMPPFITDTLAAINSPIGQSASDLISNIIKTATGDFDNVASKTSTPNLGNTSPQLVPLGQANGLVPLNLNQGQAMVNQFPTSGFNQNPLIGQSLGNNQYSPPYNAGGALSASGYNQPLTLANPVPPSTNPGFGRSNTFNNNNRDDNYYYYYPDDDDYYYYYDDYYYY